MSAFFSRYDYIPTVPGPPPRPSSLPTYLPTYLPPYSPNQRRPRRTRGPAVGRDAPPHARRRPRTRGCYWSCLQLRAALVLVFLHAQRRGAAGAKVCVCHLHRSYADYRGSYLRSSPATTYLPLWSPLGSASRLLPTYLAAHRGGAPQTLPTYYLRHGD